MSKQKKQTTAAQLVATLNKQFHAIERNMCAINRMTEITDCIGEDLNKGHKLDAAFEKTLSELKERGETVKFDTAKGEYFVGANKYRIQYRVVSVGYVEIEAPTEQIALMKAEKLTDYDEIDLVVESESMSNVTEAV